MKRILQFRRTDEGYACYENEENVFEILKTDLQFNVKEFYQAFYAEDKDFEDIEIENCVEDDKNAKRIYDCIVTLIGKIKGKLTELPKDEEISEGEEE